MGEEKKPKKKKEKNLIIEYLKFLAHDIHEHFRGDLNRKNEIVIEKIKSYIIPYLFWGFLLFIFFTFVVLLISSISQIEEHLWVPILLLVQSGVFFLQLIVFFYQTRYIKLQHQPEFIIIQKKVGDTNWNRIWIKNLGSTAHYVRWRIKLRHNVEISTMEEHPILYTLENGKEKIAFQIDENDFKKNKIVLLISYRTKTGALGSTKFLKPTDEIDFIPIEYL